MSAVFNALTDRFPNVSRIMKNRLACIVSTLLVLLLCGCMTYAPTDRWIGESREQIIQAMGKPSKELNASDARVMIFPRGPWGKHTYFVYLDQTGAMTRWSQVLEEKNFELIRPGMTRDEVVAIIGDSKVTYGLARDRGYVWNYRYMNTFCFWFNVEFTKEHIVRSTGYSKPPECRVRG
jgi:hypothetical protein